MTQDVRLIIKAGELLTKAMEMAKAKNPSFSWGLDRLCKDAVCQSMLQAGAVMVYAGMIPADQFSVACRSIALAAGGHSFVSKKSGIAYPASRPDLVAMYTALRRVYKGYKGTPAELYDVPEWERQEELVGVFKED